MIYNNPDQNLDEKFDDVLEGLQQLSGQLNEQRFPGRAWAAPMCRKAESGPPQRVSPRWRYMVAAAAIVAVVIGIRSFAPIAPRFESVEVTLPPIAGEIEPVEPPRPPLFMDSVPGPPFVNYSLVESTSGGRGQDIVIVEDSDSYTIIDLTTELPIILFARKDSFDMTDATPALLAASEESDDQT